MSVEDKIPAATEFIRTYIAENGYAPTYREIGEGIGVSSSATVHHLANLMVHNGIITMVPKKPRTMRLLDGET